jgi:hypothetical protein
MAFSGGRSRTVSFEREETAGRSECCRLTAETSEPLLSGLDDVSYDVLSGEHALVTGNAFDLGIRPIDLSYSCIIKSDPCYSIIDREKSRLTFQCTKYLNHCRQDILDHKKYSFIYLFASSARLVDRCRRDRSPKSRTNRKVWSSSALAH